MATAKFIDLEVETLRECSENSYCPLDDEEQTISPQPQPPLSESDMDSYNSSQTAFQSTIPTFNNLQRNATLYHSCKNGVNIGIRKRLENCFDDTTAEVQEDEQLKMYLRIRPEVSVSLDLDGKQARSKAENRKVLEIKDDTTVVTNPKTVNSFDTRTKMHGLRNKQTEFKFTKVLSPSCGQTVVFEECVNPLVEKFLRNENCLVFSYGATNSGKTYTLQGHGTDYGILPRTVSAIFNRIHDRLFKRGDIKPHLYQSFIHLSAQEMKSLQTQKERVLLEAVKNKKETMQWVGFQSSCQKSSVDLVEVNECMNEMNYALFANTTMFSVWVSYAEVYNEKVYDLLEVSKTEQNEKRKNLKIMHDKDGFSYISDLKELHVTSADEAYKIFLVGRKNLHVAATQINPRSSRSHSFFTIRVVSVEIEGSIPCPKTVHRMTFCDLAGLQPASQTENGGTWRKESSNINVSLNSLLNAIRILREEHCTGTNQTISFRESKLAHIFKPYLTSSTHICMIVNVNPDPNMAVSTINVLHNSAIASNVTVFRPHEPEKRKERGKKRAVNDNDKESPAKNFKLIDKHPVDSTESSTSTFTDHTYRDTFFFENDSVIKDQTVIASCKIDQQEVQFLEKKIRVLMRKMAECELEKDIIRKKCVQMLADQNREWSNRFTELRRSEVVINTRRLSLMAHKRTCKRERFHIIRKHAIIYRPRKPQKPKGTIKNRVVKRDGSDFEHNYPKKTCMNKQAMAGVGEAEVPEDHKTTLFCTASPLSETEEINQNMIMQVAERTDTQGHTVLPSDKLVQQKQPCNRSRFLKKETIQEQAKCEPKNLARGWIICCTVINFMNFLDRIDRKMI